MWRSGIAAIALVVVASCSSFDAVEPAGGSAGDGGAGDAGSTDGGACAAESCADAGPSCRSEDFAAGCGAFELGGDPKGVVHECTNGKLHIAARDTLDATATLWVDTPLVPFSARVSARIAVTKWDGGRMLRVTLGGTTSGFEVRAVLGAGGNPEFTLCDSTSGCSPLAIASAPGKEHLFVFDLTPGALSVTVDCASAATRAAIALPVKSELQLEFGKVDADPVDGTLDDVVVSFR